jgi:phage gpG-like protein
MSNKFNLSKKLQAFNQLKKDLPPILANDSEKFFRDNFSKEGFQDGNFQKWEEVQRRIPGTNAFKYPKRARLSRRTKKILSNTGMLKNSIKRTSATFNNITVTSRLIYAARHNEGLRGMPKRKFMGVSRLLERQHMKKIKLAIDKSMK